MDHPLPEGLTAEQTWELLTLVRRQTATDLPWGPFVEKEDNTGKVWCSSTHARSRPP